MTSQIAENLSSSAKMPEQIHVADEMKLKWFVSGHDFSRAEEAYIELGFSPCRCVFLMNVGYSNAGSALAPAKQ